MKAAKSVDGRVEFADLPMPDISEQFVLVRTDYSALSTGTELMLLRNKIDVFLGNSATGFVVDKGSEVSHVRIGQRVACYGVPTHAEYIVAPKHLVAPVPDHVDPSEAAFAGVGTIAVHALRQADLRFGESVAVIGLGILGQLIAQLADASACRVFAVDLLEERCRLLRQSGFANVYRSMEQLTEEIRLQTEGQGVDCVMICAGSKAQKQIDRSLEWVRDRGKIVIVGDTNTEFDRNLLFAKEAQISISRAGGPGRYDRAYEQDGFDYPYGYVRWTEGRNLREYIRMIAERRINVKPLITGDYRFEDIASAYRESQESPQTSLGVLIRFST
jgi:2-desacetyl-2-hydroxyethyl bacteriochlorophyllide A dehydrogenase